MVETSQESLRRRKCIQACGNGSLAVVLEAQFTAHSPDKLGLMIDEREARGRKRPTTNAKSPYKPDTSCTYAGRVSSHKSGLGRLWDDCERDWGFEAAPRAPARSEMRQGRGRKALGGLSGGLLGAARAAGRWWVDPIYGAGRSPPAKHVVRINVLK
jgi:hypothetical protein